MKNDKLKHIWNAINSGMEIPDPKHESRDHFSKSRSGTIQNKVRRMLHKDLVFKAVSTLAYLFALYFYRLKPDVVLICLAGLLFQAIIVVIEVRLLQAFERVSNHSLSVRDSLKDLLAFLKRKTPLYGLTIAASNITFFCSGVLLYYFLVYGQAKPMIPLSFFVYSTLLGISIIFSYLRIQSQLKFHIRHITSCLTDLNENTLEFVYNIIEKERKQDELIKVLVYFLLSFGFVVLLLALKSILV